MVLFLRSQGCDWGNLSSSIINNNGNFKFFKWVLKKGCPLPEKIRQVLTFRTVVTADDTLYFYNAAINGNFKTFKWLMKNGYSHYSTVLEEIVKGGNTKLFKWFVKHYDKSPTSAKLYGYAFVSKNMKMLKTLHKYNCPLNGKVFDCAGDYIERICEGHLDKKI